MAFRKVDIGSMPNDGTGTVNRDCWEISNSNLDDCQDQLDTKLEAADIVGKADVSYVDSGLATKADQLEVDGIKSQLSTIGSTLAGAGLVENGGSIDVNIGQGLMLSGDSVAVSQVIFDDIASKATKTELTGAVDTLNQAINQKADAVSLDGKADKTVKHTGTKGVVISGDHSQDSEISLDIATQADITNGVQNKIIDAKALVTYMSERLAIIYPGGGTPAAPANISFNSRYVMDNPFPGHAILCIAEIYYKAEWGEPGWGNYVLVGQMGPSYGFGVRATSKGGGIIVTGGSYAVAAHQSIVTGGAWNDPGDVKSAPCRVKVIRID